MTTAPPRTDAASFSSRDPLELMKTSQQLERELAESNAEVERLKAQLQQAVEIAEGLEKYGIHELTDDLRELKSKIK